MLLLLTSFVAGLLTVLAPCILPLLPVIVGGSVGAHGSGGRQRVFVIVGSLAVSVILFTLLLKASTALIGIPPMVWMWLSGGIVILFGITLLFPGLWERVPFLAKASIAANKAVGAGHTRQSFLGDVLVGAALGPVFTTCSPTYFIVLATVLPVNFTLGMVYLLAYAGGLALALIAIGLLGQRLADKLGVLANPQSAFKRGLGIIFIAVGIIVGTGLDKDIQVRLLDAGFFDVTKVEQWLLRQGEESAERPTVREPVIMDEGLRTARKAELYERVPEIKSPAGFINTQPLTLEQFRGKVVLLDIWTYSCINCVRTIPYLNAWHTAYEQDGLVIIGLHTPEFAFEKEIENVRWAVEQLGIEYPVVLDNDYATWRELGNNFWPRKYLIDVDGFIVYDHIGEGAYEETEIAIQQALMERAALRGAEADAKRPVATAVAADERQYAHSPEIYFGAWRNERLGNGVPGLVGTRAYELPQILERDTLYLEGMWQTTDEYASGVAPARIRFEYTGKDVFMVASGNGAVVRVLVDGQPISTAAGVDVVNGDLRVTEERLYHIIDDGAPGAHVLELQIIEGTLEAYTFTFG